MAEKTEVKKNVLTYTGLNKLEDELRKNAKEFGDKKGITREMLELLKIYKSS